MLDNQKQAEVLWPRLVANKLFRKPSGSHAFVADFPAPAAADDLEVEFDGGSPDADAHRCVKRPRPQQRNKTLQYRLFASTWNGGGVAPPDDLDLSGWLDTRNGTYDIYVLGFQEVVPLRARNVLGADKKRTGMRWNELIRAALNRSSPSPSPNSHDQQRSSGGEKQKVHPVRDGADGGLTRDFRCVVSKQMVGILLTVWVRGDLRRFVRRPSVSCVGCGVMGCLGNKGAVSVRFWLHDSSFCFVCCHLAKCKMCDRILWHGTGLKQKQYDRCESRLSDHRPVRALFTVEAEAPRNLNSLRSFFLSERFDRAKIPSELLRKGDDTSSARFGDDV